jgi:hypothetical protein
MGLHDMHIIRCFKHINIVEDKLLIFIIIKIKYLYYSKKMIRIEKVLKYNTLQ